MKVFPEKKGSNILFKILLYLLILTLFVAVKPALLVASTVRSGKELASSFILFVTKVKIKMK